MGDIEAVRHKPLGLQKRYSTEWLVNNIRYTDSKLVEFNGGKEATLHSSL